MLRRRGRLRGAGPATEPGPSLTEPAAPVPPPHGAGGGDGIGSADEPPAVAALLRLLAHELRTPLTSIGGFADLLRVDGDAFDAAEREGMLRRIGTNVEVLRLLTDQLADTSLLVRAGPGRPRPVPLVDLVDLVDRALSSIAGAVDVDVELVRRATLPPTIVAVDPAAGTRLVVDTLVAAASRTPPGRSVAVERAPAAHQPAAKAVLRIVDASGPPLATDTSVPATFAQLVVGSGSSVRSGGRSAAHLADALADLLGIEHWLEPHESGWAFCLAFPTA